MKTHNTMFLKLLFVLFVAGLTNCSNKGTRTGNPTVSTGLVVTSSSETAAFANKTNSVFEKIVALFLNPVWALPPPDNMVDATGNLDITLSEFWIVLKEVEFETSENATSSESDDSEISFEGPYVVDLFEQDPSSLGTKDVPSNTYKRIKWKLEHEADIPSDAPSQLDGKSLYISGTIEGNNFSYSSEDNTEFEIGGPNGITISSGDTLVANIKIADVIRKINLSALNSAGDKNISDTNRISSSSPCNLIDESAEDLYTCFRKGIESESDFGRDLDDNFELEDGDESVKGD